MTAEIIRSTVRFDRHGDCALLTLDRADKLNALTTGMLDEVESLLAEVTRSDARAVLITGAGDRAFCAGADLDESAGKTPDEHRAGIRRGQQVLDAVASLSIPSVALINGLALGGGLEVALACDFRLCVAHARLGFPEVKVGLLPGYGGTQRLPRLVAPAIALEMVLSGDPVDARRASAIGLVNKIVESDLLAEGLGFARRITKHSLIAVRLARTAVRAATTTELDAGMRLEADLSTEAYSSEDARDGIAAFIAKRQPSFHDR
jgi:enoyl-CoA hydratase